MNGNLKHKLQKVGEYVLSEAARAGQIAVVQPIENLTKSVAKEAELTVEGLVQSQLGEEIIETRRRGKLLCSTAPDHEVRLLRRS